MDKQDYESEYKEEGRVDNPTDSREEDRLDNPTDSKEEEKALNPTDSKDIEGTNNRSKLKKTLLISGIILLVLLFVFVWLAFTKSGHSVIYKIAGSLIHEGLDTEEEIEASTIIIPYDKVPDKEEKDKIELNETNNNEPPIIKEEPTPRIKPDPREEDCVCNYLLFGLEEIFNAKNADTIMIASINIEDNTIKLTSILRDTYIDIEGYNPNKINAFFSLGGAKGFVNVIEDKYRIKIDGYAYLNFNSFEKIIDYLGGIAIELGDEEAEYLNTTNYISDPANRTVNPGWNDLNGNQALGYCRIRLVETIGGANDDYGRTLRQRRVLKAVFNKYKSKGLIDLLRITNNILGYIKTNVTKQQIEKALEDIIENKISKMDTMRLPANGAYEAPIKYQGIGYPLVYDWDENIIQLYQFIYLDTREEAEANLEKYR